MRISDWSSDVCSSDLATIFTRGGAAIATGLATCAHGCTDLTSRLRTAAEGAALCTRCQGHFIGIDDAVAVLVGPATHGGGALADGSAVIADRHAALTDRRGAEAQRRGTRSEERRVGKECVSTCRSWC